MSSHPLETAPARHRRTAMTIDAETLLDRRAPRGRLPLLPDRPVK
jgi:hypothetical protein